MIFTNGRLIFPDGVRDGLEVVCAHGKIAEVRTARGSVQREAVDLAGNYLAAGFIDLHVHGAVGRDAMEATGEAFTAICDHHASGGTTSLLLTTATAPMLEILSTLRAARASRAELRQIAGVHVEGPFISRVKAGAQRQECITAPDDDAVQQLLAYADVIERLTLAPELPGAVDAIAAFYRAGVVVSGGHSDASDAEAALGFESGMRAVTHTFNCMSSARKRDGKRIAGLLEFALSEPAISCELIADGHHVSPTLMKMLYRAKGAAGICLVTDATAGAGLPEGSEFNLAGRECIVSEGACYLADRSALAGSAARMIDLVQTMVRAVGVPLHEAIAMATAHPARALRSRAKGHLTPGFDADLVVLSPKLELLQTWSAGEEVYRALSSSSA